MRFFLVLIFACAAVIHQVSANGNRIVKAARSQIGVPYSWGGGGIHGKSFGIGPGAHIIGFDCSGLAQYAVYKGTNKIIARTSSLQYVDRHCYHIPYNQHKPGDLVFFGHPAYHVGIVSVHGMMINAAHSGTRVREERIWSTHDSKVSRCW